MSTDDQPSITSAPAKKAYGRSPTTTSTTARPRAAPASSRTTTDPDLQEDTLVLDIVILTEDFREHSGNQVYAVLL